MNAQTTSQKIDTVIVGLGATGLSVARFLERQNRAFAVVDSRENPPNAEELKRDFENAPVHFGSFDSNLLEQAKQLVVNPGIAVATPEIRQAQHSGADIVGDIELFAQEVANSRPVIAITGSNGKTTVTLLLDLMAKKSGVKVATGGNIGTPALDLLNQDADLFVLELSSFQLETTRSLHTVAAVVLNVSEDHLDRYDYDLNRYAQSKGEIYRHCKHVICNRDDDWSMRLAEQVEANESLLSFGLDKPQPGHFGLLRDSEGNDWLARGDQRLMRVSEMRLPGRHNQSNALAALALGDAAGLDMQAMLEVLREFAGIEHRTQWLRELDGVNWFNDSKGTNVGATVAALSGLSGKTVLIAGGQGKGADFLPLTQVVREKARALVLMGEDADKIAAVLDDKTPHYLVNSLQEAVQQAQQLAQSGDNVLLSPACASFDMFSNYEERGKAFIALVEKLETLENNLEKMEQANDKELQKNKRQTGREGNHV